MNAQSCPICTGGVRAFFKDTDSLLECKDCGIVFDTRVSLRKGYYENERSPHVDEQKVRSRRRNVKQRITLLKQYLKKDCALLDIGCGEGLLLKELQDKIRDVKGIEPTVFYADYAKNQLALDVRQGLVEDIDFPLNSFDVITIFHVLEHFENLRTVLGKMCSWLKPGGYLVVEVPNIKSPSARRRGIHWEMITPEHRFHFSPNSLSRILNKYGFQIISVKTRDFDQYRTGIGKNIRKLWLDHGSAEIKKTTTKREGRERKQAASKKSMTRYVSRIIQLPLKGFLGWLVMKLNRSDYLFAIARKNEK